MDRRPLAEDLLEPVRIGSRDLGRVEPSEPLLQLERAGERGRNRHLLVEDEPDEERQRLGGEQLVRLGVPGEVQRVGHASILAPGVERGDDRTEREGGAAPRRGRAWPQ